MKLSELRKLGEAATEGPWQNTQYRFDSVYARGENLFHGNYCKNKDGRFIAAARNHWSALMEVVEAANEVSIDLAGRHLPVSADTTNRLHLALAALEAIGEEEENDQ